MITDIRLQNFKLYADGAFDFSDGVNIIVGPNACGKTTLLEAIYIVASGKTMRSQTDNPITFNKHWAKIDAHTEKESRSIKVVDDSGKLTKTFNIDNNEHKRMPSAKSLPAVVFEPQHLLIFSRRPDLRRDYLDDILDAIKPEFKKLRLDYKRALAQRNNLLKKGGHMNSIFPWNIRVSELGGQIANYRIGLVERLKVELEGFYTQISGTKDNITTEYSSKVDLNNYSSNLLKKLETSLELDILRGHTTLGPHRDDLTIKINGHVAQDSASRGESRSILLALKILELKILEQETGQTPLMLLDDVFSELDGSRRKALTKFLEKQQTFITTTDADIIQHDFTKKSNVIAISN